jgi:hypothetical protein
VSIYRHGRHHDDTVYLQLGDEPSYTDERVAIFVRGGGENELDALHYVRAMNATMPGCTCPVVCSCGALVGTTSGCETCAEHENECQPPPDEVAYLLWSSRHDAWWRPDACGYTTVLKNAGRYTRDEAVRHVVASAQCGVREQVTCMVAAPENWPVSDG